MPFVVPTQTRPDPLLSLKPYIDTQVTREYPEPPRRFDTRINRRSIRIKGLTTAQVDAILSRHLSASDGWERRVWRDTYTYSRTEGFMRDREERSVRVRTHTWGGVSVYDHRHRLPAWDIVWPFYEIKE